MDGFHVEGMTEDKRDVFIGAEVSQPIPGEDTLDGYDQAVMVGGNGLEKGFRSGFHIAVHENFAIVAQDTDVHGTGM